MASQTLDSFVKELPSRTKAEGSTGVKGQQWWKNPGSQAWACSQGRGFEVPLAIPGCESFPDPLLEGHIDGNTQGCGWLPQAPLKGGEALAGWLCPGGRDRDAQALRDCWALGLS